VKRFIIGSALTLLELVDATKRRQLESRYRDYDGRKPFPTRLALKKNTKIKKASSSTGLAPAPAAI